MIAEQVSPINLLVGKDVIALLSDESFLTAWDNLYYSCSWATVYQSREYVIPWYNIYQQAYLPILLKAEQGDKLTGLLTLALPISDDRNTKKFIVGVGHYDADYQTWLTEASNGETFIKAAITELKHRFPHQDIMLRHVLANTPLNWLQTDPQWKRLCIIQSFSRPLMDMKTATISKQSRSRISRLKKVCNFEVITNQEAFNSILEEHAFQYDFRQGALFNLNPFKNDPLKKKFMLALYDNKLLQITILKAQEKIVSCLAVVKGKNRAHLGSLNFHSPSFARFSPGFVHFLMIGQQFATDDLEFFDLTPGGEPYKERLATSHDLVYEIVITSNRNYYLKRHIKKHVYNYLIKAGIRPLSIKLYLHKKIYHIKERGIIFPIVDQVKKIFEAKKQKVYVLKGKPPSHKSTLLIELDNFSDLLKFESTDKKLSRWEFLENAMKRFETGEHIYTFAENGRLLNGAWFSSLELTHPAENKLINNLQVGDAKVQEIYCHPDGQSSLRKFLIAVTNEVAKSSKTGNVYVIADASNSILCQTLEEVNYNKVD